MDPWTLVPILLMQIAALVFMSAIFSGTETGLYSLNRVKLRYRVNQDDARARAVDRLLFPIGPTIITILIGNNITAQLLTLATDTLFIPLGAWSVLVTTLVLTPVLLVFGEFAPKSLFRRYADAWIYQLSYFVWSMRILLWVPVVLARGATWLFEQLIPGRAVAVWEPHTERANLRAFLRNDRSVKGFTAVQQELVDRILALERIDLRYEGVSKPLGAIQAVDGGATVSAVVNGLGPKYFARYLVRSHTDNEPIGYVSATTLAIADGKTLVSELVHELPRLKSTTSLSVALQRMHERGADMALVVDPDDDKPFAVAFRGDALRVMIRMERDTRAATSASVADSVG